MFNCDPKVVGEVPQEVRLGLRQPLVVPAVLGGARAARPRFAIILATIEVGCVYMSRDRPSGTSDKVLLIFRLWRLDSDRMTTNKQVTSW